jgi:hypothetical protein
MPVTNFPGGISDGPAASGRRVSGTTALDGSNPTPVVTGLTTVTGFVCTLVRNSAVSSGTAFLTHGAPSGGTVDVYGWLQTGAASTGTESFDWVAVGT